MKRTEALSRALRIGSTAREHAAGSSSPADSYLRERSRYSHVGLLKAQTLAEVAAVGLQIAKVAAGHLLPKVAWLHR